MTKKKAVCRDPLLVSCVSRGPVRVSRHQAGLTDTTRWSALSCGFARWGNSQGSPLQIPPERQTFSHLKICIHKYVYKHICIRIRVCVLEREQPISSAGSPPGACWVSAQRLRLSGLGRHWAAAVFHLAFHVCGNPRAWPLIAASQVCRQEAGQAAEARLSVRHSEMDAGATHSSLVFCATVLALPHTSDWLIDLGLPRSASSGLIVF